jgi:acetylornithine deacetylase
MARSELTHDSSAGCVATPDRRTLAALDALIGFDTTCTKSNLVCIDWARAELEAAGARTRTDWNADRSKANLFATFGEGPGGIVLSGHTDVVPVDGQDWASDPFRLDIREGRAFGRGSCDMKGFVASVLGHVADYQRAAGRAPIHVALTYDEERGCLGIPHLIAELARAGIRPAGALIGEPTMMRLVSAHKGGRIFRCRARGKAAHSSLTHQAVNAIQAAARVIARIDAMARRFQGEGRRVAGFDVPFTTISTNLFSGGNGSNIVPAEAEFLFDYRYVPGDDPDAIIAEIRDFAETEVVPAMQAIDPGCGLEITEINRVPALDARSEDMIYRLVHDLLADKTVEKVAYGTEASFFQEYGVPSVVCGPGSIAQAHKADEFVSLDQLAACDRLIAALVGRLATGPASGQPPGTAAAQ